MSATPRSARIYPAKPGRVYLFATCLVDQFSPAAGLDAVRLLEREAIAVHFPRAQTCCGQPAYSSGFADAARAVARRQLDLFPEPWPIVVPSGSCAAMMRHQYPALFADDASMTAKAQALADRVFELTEFLVNVAHFARPDTGPPCTVALHTSCQARRQMGVHESSSRLLQALAQVTIAEQARAEECCGFGGTFALRFPDISEAMVGDKVQSLVECGAERVLSADSGCLFNIAGCAAKQDQCAQRTSASLPGEHIASFLWRRTAPAAA